MAPNGREMHVRAKALELVRDEWATEPLFKLPTRLLCLTISSDLFESLDPLVIEARRSTIVAPAVAMLEFAATAARAWASTGWLRLRHCLSALLRAVVREEDHEEKYFGPPWTTTSF